MRPLPDNPNVEFLRRQAKELLAAMRESEPSTTLSHAQHELARQYGCHSWSRLRQEVEVRRAQPPMPPDGLATGIAEAFDLGEVESIEPLALSQRGRTWSLTTSRGRWLADPGYPWMTAELAETGARLQERGAADGVQVLRPRRDHEGALLVAIAGGVWGVSEWRDLGPAPVHPVRSGVVGRIGEIAATLHTAAIPNEPPIHPYLTWRRPPQEWEELLARARAAGTSWAGRLADVLPRWLELSSVATSVPGSGLILCHANLIPENVRLASGDDVVVLEWTFAGSLTAELEVASQLVHWAGHAGPRPVAVAAYVEGYRRVAGSFPPLRLDPFAVAISGYLNWVHNTVCEALSATEPAALDLARRETDDLLEHPLTVDAIELMVELSAR